MLEILDVLIGIGSGVSWAIVPSTGEIKFSGLAKEKTSALQPLGYASTSTSYYTPISLLDLAETFQNFEGTNTNGVNYPNSSKPHSISEWYGYDHDYGLSCSSLISISLYPQTSLNCITSKPPITMYVNNSVWASATQLYRNQGGNSCIPANAGWYHYGGSTTAPVRYWNGSAFTQNSGCP